MMALAKKYWSPALAMSVGFMIAVLMTPMVLTVYAWYAQWEEENNPPAVLKWHSLTRVEEDVLRITLFVTRKRDCPLVRVLGYTGDSLGVMYPADVMSRADGLTPQSYPVGLTVISRPWILHGVYGSKVAVSAYYDCDSRIVKAPLLIGDVPSFTP